MTSLLTASGHDLTMLNYRVESPKPDRPLNLITLSIGNFANVCALDIGPNVVKLQKIDQV